MRRFTVLVPILALALAGPLAAGRVTPGTAAQGAPPPRPRR